MIIKTWRLYFLCSNFMVARLEYEDYNMKELTIEQVNEVSGGIPLFIIPFLTGFGKGFTAGLTLGGTLGGLALGAAALRDTK